MNAVKNTGHENLQADILVIGGGGAGLAAAASSERRQPDIFWAGSDAVEPVIISTPSLNAPPEAGYWP